MAEVIFNFEGNNTTIQCNINENMKDIINKFLIKIDKKEEDNLYYLYNGSRINPEITFNEQSNESDKNRKKINILVYKNTEYRNKVNQKISKDIICPECKENSLLNKRF